MRPKIRYDEKSWKFCKILRSAWLIEDISEIIDGSAVVDLGNSFLDL